MARSAPAYDLHANVPIGDMPPPRLVPVPLRPAGMVGERSICRAVQHLMALPIERGVHLWQRSHGFVIVHFVPEQIMWVLQPSFPMSRAQRSGNGEAVSRRHLQAMHTQAALV